MPDLEYIYAHVDVITGDTQQHHAVQALDSQLSLHSQLPLVSKKYVLYLRSQISIVSLQYFEQIQWLIQQNSYLDVLRHSTWILFNTENIRLHADRNYWSLNLRPAHDFDDSTWKPLS